VNAQFGFLKVAYRNHSEHAHDDLYGMPKALHILNQVKEFMRMLEKAAYPNDGTTCARHQLRGTAAVDPAQSALAAGPDDRFGSIAPILTVYRPLLLLPKTDASRADLVVTQPSTTVAYLF